VKYITLLPVALLATLALMSCKTEPVTTEKNTGPCNKKVQLLREWLRELDQASPTGPPSFSGFGLNIPMPSGQPYRANKTAGPWLELSPSELRFESGKLPTRDAAAILDLFSKLHQSGKTKNEGSSHPFALQLIIHDDTPWSSVVATFRTAYRAGFRKVALPYQVPLEKYPLAPPPSSLDEDLKQLAGKPPNPPALFDLLAGLATDCPEAGKVTEGIAHQGTVEFAVAGASLAEAIGACDCKVDIPAVKAVLWFGFYPRTEPAIAIDLAGPEQPEAITVGIPGIVPYRVAFKKLQKASSQERPLRFEFQGKGTRGIQP
jgi:hypothetical protein